MGGDYGDMEQTMMFIYTQTKKNRYTSVGMEKKRLKTGLLIKLKSKSVFKQDLKIRINENNSFNREGKRRNFWHLYS